MKTYEEALANAKVADQKLSELAASVQRVIAAAEGSFSYYVPADDDTGTGTVPPAAPEEAAADETSDIDDALVPLADGASLITGSDNGGSADGTAVIADGSVPLAAVTKEQSGRHTAGVMGMFSALFAALLLLFKRKKDEEEQEQAVQ